MTYPYTFTAGGETFLGYTIPGCASMRIVRQRDDMFYVTFDPQVDGKQHKVAGGMWSNVNRATDFAVLAALAPQVLAACDARYKAILDIKTGHATRSVRRTHTRAMNGFDGDYFID